MYLNQLSVRPFIRNFHVGGTGRCFLQLFLTGKIIGFMVYFIISHELPLLVGILSLFLENIQSIFSVTIFYCFLSQTQLA